MVDFVSAIRGALSGPKPPTSGEANTGDRARAKSEYDQAVDHYSFVSKNTKDKKTLDDAHQRLMAATMAMGKFH